MSEPDSLILQILRQMRAELATKADLESVRSEVAEIKSDMRTLRADVAADMRSLRADIAADILSTRKELSEQIVGLRRSVVEHHTSVIGHAALISELEARVRRVEQHLNLPSLRPT